MAFLFFSFEDNADRTGHKRYFISVVKIKDENSEIDRRRFSLNDLRTYDNIQEIRIGRGDGYTTGFLLDYPYLKENYKLIAI